MDHTTHRAPLHRSLHGAPNGTEARASDTAPSSSRQRGSIARKIGKASGRARDGEASVHGSGARRSASIIVDAAPESSAPIAFYLDLRVVDDELEPSTRRSNGGKKSAKYSIVVRYGDEPEILATAFAARVRGISGAGAGSVSTVLDKPRERDQVQLPSSPKRRGFAIVEQDTRPRSASPLASWIDQPRALEGVADTIRAHMERQSVRKAGAGAFSEDNEGVLPTVANLEGRGLDSVEAGRLLRSASSSAISTALLCHNALDSVWCLPRSLTALNLTDNRFRDLQGFRSLIHLRRLDLSRNYLTATTELRSNTCLEELLLAQNQISSIAGLEGLSRLVTLDLSKNCLRSTESLRALSIMPALRSLDLLGNPVADSSVVVRNLLPQVHLIDGVSQSGCLESVVPPSCVRNPPGSSATDQRASRIGCNRSEPVMRGRYTRRVGVSAQTSKSVVPRDIERREDDQFAVAEAKVDAEVRVAAEHRQSRHAVVGLRSAGGTPDELPRSRVAAAAATAAYEAAAAARAAADAVAELLRGAKGSVGRPVSLGASEQRWQESHETLHVPPSSSLREPESFLVDRESGESPRAPLFGAPSSASEDSQVLLVAPTTVVAAHPAPAPDASAVSSVRHVHIASNERSERKGVEDARRTAPLDTPEPTRAADTGGSSQQVPGKLGQQDRPGAVARGSATQEHLGGRASAKRLLTRQCGPLGSGSSSATSAVVVSRTPLPARRAVRKPTWSVTSSSQKNATPDGPIRAGTTQDESSPVRKEPYVPSPQQPTVRRRIASSGRDTCADGDVRELTPRFTATVHVKRSRRSVDLCSVTAGPWNRHAPPHGGSPAVGAIPRLVATGETRSTGEESVAPDDRSDHPCSAHPYGPSVPAAATPISHSDEFAPDSVYDDIDGVVLARDAEMAEVVSNALLFGDAARAYSDKQRDLSSADTAHAARAHDHGAESLQRGVEVAWSDPVAPDPTSVIGRISRCSTEGKRNGSMSAQAAPTRSVSRPTRRRSLLYVRKLRHSVRGREVVDAERPLASPTRQRRHAKGTNSRTRSVRGPPRVSLHAVGTRDTPQQQARRLADMSEAEFSAAIGIAEQPPETDTDIDVSGAFAGISIVAEHDSSPQSADSEIAARSSISHRPSSYGRVGTTPASPQSSVEAWLKPSESIDNDRSLLPSG